VQTPCADISGVLSQGVMQVVSDPRTTVVECLEAVLNAELMDNDGWSMLLKLMESKGGGEFTDQIEEAEEHEREHLTMVRGWLSALVVGESGNEELSETESKPATKSKKGAGKTASSPKASSKPSPKPSSKNHR
jgi:rubrerythrin